MLLLCLSRAISSVWLERYLDMVEVTGSSPVLPTKKATSCEAAFFFLLWILRFRQALANPLVAGAVHTRGFLDTAFGIDEFRFAFWKQAGHFFEDGVEELIFGDGFDDFAFAEDDAAAFAASQPDIGIAGFAGAVDDAAHDGDVDGSLHFGEALLDLVGDAYDIDLDTATGWAGDKGDTAIAQFERTQDFVGDGDLLLWFRAQADANGVTDTTGKQQAQTYRGLYRTCDERSRFGDAEV